MVQFVLLQLQVIQGLVLASTRVAESEVKCLTPTLAFSKFLMPNPTPTPSKHE